MSDQPVTHPLLVSEFERFYREVFLPDFQRIVDEVFSASEKKWREHSQRLFVRSVTGSLKFLESMYGFLQGGIHRLERRLDDIHVRMERSNSGDMTRQLELAHDYFDDAFATWTRLKGYLDSPDVGGTIDRIADGPAKEGLQAEAVDLRRRVEALAPTLDTAGMRLNRYTRRIG